jgi:hypothetical protein
MLPRRPVYSDSPAQQYDNAGRSGAGSPRHAPLSRHPFLLIEKTAPLTVFHARIRQRDAAEMLVHQDDFLPFLEPNRKHGCCVPGSVSLPFRGIGLRQGDGKCDQRLLRGLGGGVAGFQHSSCFNFCSAYVRGLSSLAETTNSFFMISLPLSIRLRASAIKACIWSASASGAGSSPKCRAAIIRAAKSLRIAAWTTSACPPFKSVSAAGILRRPWRDTRDHVRKFPDPGASEKA